MKPSWKGMRVLLLAAVLASGCGDDDDGDTRVDAGGDAGTSDGGGLDASMDSGLDGAVGSSDAGDAGLPEEQIVDITSAANSGEILTSQVAANGSKAQNAMVLSFAQDMIAMHTAAQARQDTLATSLGLQRRASVQGDLMRATATQLVQQLQALEQGPAFDRAYVMGQVMLHTATLQAIDQQLLPSAKSAALRQELTSSRGEVATHLARAQTLQAALQGDAGAED